MNRLASAHQTGDPLLRFLIHELRLFFIALQFFTRVPIPAWVGFESAWLHDSIRYFPLVGALVGGFGSVVLLAASLLWPPVVAVLLSMAATVWMTGGFHEDGWADTCDGLGGTVSGARSLEIMKDSRIGTYGALGLCLLLGLKAAILVSLVSPLFNEMVEAVNSHIHQVLLGWTVMGLVWAHSVSRLVPVLLIRWLPYAGDLDHAKAKPLATRVSLPGLFAAVGLTLLTALMLIGCVWWLDWPVGTLYRCLLWSGLAAMLMALWCGRWFAKRLGGYTGDTLGASQQLSEVACLLAWLAVVHPLDWVRW